MNASTSLTCIAVVLLLCSAVAPAAGVAGVAHQSPAVDRPAPAVTDPTGESGSPAIGTLNERPTTSAGPTAPTPTAPRRPNASVVAEVTLLTGQTVSAVERNGTVRYRSAAAAEMYTVRTDRGTYVFPADVDFSTFDPSLFNVDLLRQQNLTDAESASIPVIVKDRDGSATGAGVVGTSSATATTDALSSVSSVETDHRLQSIGAAAGSVTKREATTTADELRTDPDVSTVALDIEYRIENDESDRIVGGEAARRAYNASGEGVTVAVLDTGINESHPDLRGQVVDSVDFADSDGSVEDVNGHGTHVAATIAGTGAASNGTYAGIAPNASLMEVRVLGDFGGGSTSDIIDGMEYARANGADVISMSLGGPVRSPRTLDPFSTAVNESVAAGVPVVVAAGNDGEYMTVGSPGVTRKAITVGATDKNGEMAPFSSRGPTPYGYYVKPDVVAPGENVVSACAANSRIAAYYDCGPDTKYAALDGTSMATPVTSGTVALMLSQDGGLTPGEVKSHLVSTADPIAAPNVYSQGGGRINASEALDSVAANDTGDADVVVSPGTTDFGSYHTDTNETKPLTVSNEGGANATLELNATAKNVVTVGAGDATVSLNRTSLTLAPGESATVGLTVKPGSDIGAYSGRVSVTNSSATATFGFARTAELTLRKEGYAATNTSGDPLVILPEGSADEFQRRLTVGQFGGNTATGVYTQEFLTSSEYRVYTLGINETNGAPVAVTDTFALDGDTTVTFTENDTVTHDVDIAERPPTDTRAMTMRLGPVASVHAPDPNTSAVYVGSDTDVEVSTTRFMTPGNATGLNASEVYYMTSVASGDSEAVDTVELGESSDVTYYRGEPNTTYNATFRSYAGRPLASGSVGTRRTQSVYFRSWYYARPMTVQGYEDGTGVEGWEGAPHVVSPLYDADVARGPFVGGARSWAIEDDRLKATLATQAMAGSNVINDTSLPAYNDSDTDSLTVTVGGRTVTDRSVRNGSVNVDASVGAGESVSVRTDANNGAFAHSTRTVATYHATARSGDSAPPTLTELGPPRLNTLEEAPNGTTEVDLLFADRTGTNAEVSAYWASEGDDVRTTPFDGNAAGWREAVVTRDEGASETVGGVTYRAYTLVLNTTGYSGDVDLAVSMTDAAGNSATTTTFEAFEVRDTPPEPAFELLGERYAAPVGANATLSASDSWDNYGVVSYEWTVEGERYTGENVTHRFETRGEAPVTLTVTDTAGNSATLSESVPVVDTEPFAFLMAPNTVEVGENVTLNASRSRDAQGIEAYRWDVDGDYGVDVRTENATLTRNFTETGIHEVRVEVVDTAGQVAADEEDFVVVEAEGGEGGNETDTPGGGSVGRSSGGGGGGQSGPVPARVDPVDTEEGATVVVYDADGATPVVANLPEGAAASGTAAVTAVNLSLTFDTERLRVEVTDPTTEPPTGVPPVESGGAMTYFTADARNVDPANVDGADLHVTVNESRLPAGTEPERVTVYRYHDEEWRALDTRHLDGERYVAATPGFSAFAVGLSEPPEPSDERTFEPETSATDTETATASNGTSTAEGGTGTDASGVGAGALVLLVIGIGLLALLLLAMLARRQD
jgi:PGF-pre-PGF domain-containing protein